MKDNYSLNSEVAACSQGFVKCFPRVPQAIGLYYSRHARELSENTLQCLRTKLPTQTVEKPSVHFDFNSSDSGQAAESFVCGIAKQSGINIQTGPGT